MNRRQVIVGITAVALGAAVAPALAGETLCAGPLHGDVTGNLRVSRGDLCELDGIRVRGNVTVDRNGLLITRDTHIAGNVQGLDADVVSIGSRSTVRGNIQVSRARFVSLSDSRIGGNVQLTEIEDVIELHENSIGGNLQAVNSDASVSIIDNRIGGNLNCRHNRLGGDSYGNDVNGNIDGECAER